MFELKEDESLIDLINISGGASSNSYKSKIFIERFDDFSKKIIEVDKKDFIKTKLVDGDKISFKEIKNESISDVVKIGGAVNIEGNFQYSNNNTIADLLNSARGFSKDKLGASAILYRKIMVLIINQFH